MLIEDLDPASVVAFLAFLAAFAAGGELSQMHKYRPDQKGAALTLILFIAALFLMYLFGGNPPALD